MQILTLVNINTNILVNNTKIASLFFMMAMSMRMYMRMFIGLYSCKK